MLNLVTYFISYTDCSCGIKFEIQLTLNDISINEVHNNILFFLLQINLSSALKYTVAMRSINTTRRITIYPITSNNSIHQNNIIVAVLFNIAE